MIRGLLHLLNLILDALLVAIELFVKLDDWIFNILLILKTNHPYVLDIFNYILENLVIFLRGFNVMFTLRFMLSWFPNINPFIAPYYLVRVATQPYIDFVEKRLPKIFGQDISFFICSFILNFVLEYLPRIRF